MSDGFADASPGVATVAAATLSAIASAFTRPIVALPMLDPSLDDAIDGSVNARIAKNWEFDISSKPC